MEKLLNRLIEIRNDPTTIYTTSYGICHAVARAGIDDTLMHPLFRKWPEFSGIVSHPVPSFDEDVDAIDMYHYTGNMWDKETEYGRARWRLVNFMIEELSNG